MDYVNPHVEVRLELPVPDGTRLPWEINADALGLDTDTIQSGAEAVETLQHDLGKYFARYGDKERLHTIREWRSRFPDSRLNGREWRC